MNKNEKQFKGIPPSVIFMPSTYRNYIDIAKQLYLMNLHDVEDYIAMTDAPLHLSAYLHGRLITFHSICVELMNQDCQHGYFRPDALDVRRLLGWIKSTAVLVEKVSIKVRTLEEGA
ncbi:TPA: hypothetical protein H1O82_003095 [Salmonella enterica]|nr:hypothetical protein [Salmonella enterica]